MPVFTFRARRPSGEIVKGERDTGNRELLKQELARDGLFLVDASPTKSAVLQASLGMGRRKVRLPALIAFVREFRVLVGSGLPMGQILSILSERDDDPRLAEAIRGLRAGVEQGLALDEAATAQDSAFDGMFLASLAAGVRTGRLEDALARLETFLGLKAELRRKIRKALAYPIFLLFLLAAVLITLMLFVLPRFAELYAEFGSDLPGPTALLMALTRSAPVWVPLGAAGVIASGWVLRRLFRRPTLRLALEKWLMHLPILGPILLDLALVQNCYLLAMLLGSGMPLRDALKFLSEGQGNSWVRAQFHHIQEKIEAGRSISDAAAETGLFPPATASMLRAGDISGDLSGMLVAITRMHEQTLDERMSKVLALIEPIMMLLVGGVLGAVIIAVYLPIFGISSVVR
jgi:type IV pilus assembly protein PilC